MLTSTCPPLQAVHTNREKNTPVCLSEKLLWMLQVLGTQTPCADIIILRVQTTIPEAPLAATRNRWLSVHTYGEMAILVWLKSRA